jgi:hypothetical protein
MTGTTHPQAAAYDTWAEVIVLLDEAADRGYRDSATDPALHSTALAAFTPWRPPRSSCCHPSSDHLVDQIVPPPAATRPSSPVELIRAAEAATTAPHRRPAPRGLRDHRRDLRPDRGARERERPRAAGRRPQRRRAAPRRRPDRPRQPLGPQACRASQGSSP